MAIELHAEVYALAEKCGIDYALLSPVGVLKALGEWVEMARSKDALAGFESFLRERWRTGLSQQLRGDLQACWGAARSFIPAEDRALQAAVNIAEIVTGNLDGLVPDSSIKHDLNCWKGAYRNAKIQERM